MSNEIATEVAIKVLETKPAVVNFNFQEISDNLDAVLQKYEGLVFTEGTAADCKKTIAELRKGQNALETFRKGTKADLTKSVTAFENQCKTLFTKFETVIKPLTKQQEQFETDRKTKKRAEIQVVIDSLVIEKSLAGKFASRLVIQDDYLNKGRSMISIKTDLALQAGTLKAQQDKEEQDADLVKTKVDLANAQYQLSNSLAHEPYLRLLNYKSVAEIEILIASDAEAAKNRETKAAEVAAAKNLAVSNDIAAPIRLPAPSPINRPDPIQFNRGTINAALIIPVDPSEKITATYKVTGTEEQLSALEAYLDSSGLTWIDLT